MRRTAMALLLLFLTHGPSAADAYTRESLRIPFAAAGPRGLEALLVRPADGKTYPLALISHGTPREADERPKMTPGRYYMQAIEFARHGFAVLIIMRRGYGDSGGELAEYSGACGSRDYLQAGRHSAEDLKAAIDAMSRRSDVTVKGMIAIGQSTGGFASVALAADAPEGLAAIINFAGGRGSRGDNDVCDQDNLVAAFGTFGKTARAPMLWIYSENDLFFWPELARRFHAAFQASGGRAKFEAAPPFGRDGHSLFSPAGSPLWIPMINGFLREQNLGLRTLLPPLAGDALPAPAHFLQGGSGREAFKQYLKANDHKAFAVSKNGQFAWRAGARTERDAQLAAREACERRGDICTIYAVNDELEAERARSR